MARYTWPMQVPSIRLHGSYRYRDRPALEDALARAERLDLYMKHGLTVSAKWLRDVESIPDPTDGEEVVGGKPSAPPKPAPKPSETPPPPADEAA